MINKGLDLEVAGFWRVVDFEVALMDFFFLDFDEDGIRSEGRLKLFFFYWNEERMIFRFHDFDFLVQLGVEVV